MQELDGIERNSFKILLLFFFKEPCTICIRDYVAKKIKDTAEGGLLQGLRRFRPTPGRLLVRR